MSKSFESIEDKRAYARQLYAVRRDRGKASSHICGCEEQAAEWAHAHNADHWDVNTYIPMCRKCHHEYDDRWNAEERARVSASLKKHHASLSEESRQARGRNISEGKIGKSRTPATEQARENMRTAQRRRRAEGR